MTQTCSGTGPKYFSLKLSLYFIQVFQDKVSVTSFYGLFVLCSLGIFFFSFFNTNLVGGVVGWNGFSHIFFLDREGDQSPQRLAGLFTETLRKVPCLVQLWACGNWGGQPKGCPTSAASSWRTFLLCKTCHPCVVLPLPLRSSTQIF